MNIALHLAHAGLAERRPTALFNGASLVADDGMLALRPASLAASLRQRFALAQGERHESLARGLAAKA